MNILITSASTRLARRLASELSADHNVRLTDRKDVPGAQSFTLCDLDHGQATNDLVRGVDVIIHSGEVDSALSVSGQLDDAMRCAYNLLWAASEEKVPRLIYLNSLNVMGRHDESYAVTERWKPAPTTETSDLGYHLGEFVCREFARESKIDVISLRLGELVWDDEEASSSALYPVDAVQAVRKALTAEVSDGYAGSNTNWHVFHIQSAVPNARFLTTTAQQTLGYEPSSR
ncbi:MAG: NAD(P)-dependent oxidoreductase [Chloroflexi bacterium]|nr:NAD(P)-dependent oxidoreductase [Chloroflexota bacterium]